MKNMRFLTTPVPGSLAPHETNNAPIQLKTTSYNNMLPKCKHCTGFNTYMTLWKKPLVEGRIPQSYPASLSHFVRHKTDSGKRFRNIYTKYSTFFLENIPNCTQSFYVINVQWFFFFFVLYFLFFKFSRTGHACIKTNLPVIGIYHHESH